MENFVNYGIKPQLSREGQILVVLQATPKICELNGRDWPADAAVLLGMQFVFTRIKIGEYVARSRPSNLQTCDMACRTINI